MKRIEQILATIIVALVATAANAASLSFVYTGDNNVDSDGTVVAAVNDLLTFDIVMDFTDNPTVGGRYDVVYTTDTLRFEAWELMIVGDPALNAAPEKVCEQCGLLFSAAFGSFEGVTGPATVARVSFTFLGGPDATLELALSPGIGNVFLSTDFWTPIWPEFGSATVRTPLPGAAWFLLSALGALGALRRAAQA